MGTSSHGKYNPEMLVNVEYSNHVGAYPAGNPGRQQLELLGFQM
jgi:hypothetical protein